MPTDLTPPGELLEQLEQRTIARIFLGHGIEAKGLLEASRDHVMTALVAGEELGFLPGSSTAVGLNTLNSPGKAGFFTRSGPGGSLILDIPKTLVS